MRIIIVGCGKVGFTLAEDLSGENHDVIIVDNSDAALARASESLDVLCIKGNGASISVLKDAGVERADLVIATTPRDELNMVTCLTAKKLGAKHSIARIRDYEYARELSQLKSEMDIDMVINPEYATATQISRLLRFPNTSAIDVETFLRGRVELVGFLVDEGDIIAGSPLSVVRRKLGNMPVLFCAAEQGGQTIIPNGSTVFHPGDKVYVIGDVVGVNHFFKLLGRISHRVKDVLIVGGGRIGMYLAQSLASVNISIKIVEISAPECEKLCEVIPKALVIHGDGTEQELLNSENVGKCDAFVALTGRDEDNLITALYAKKMGAGKVVAKINRQNYYDILGSLRIDSVISPKAITAYTILRYVRAMQNSRGSRMEALYRIADGKAEAMTFSVNGNTRHLNTPIKDLNVKNGVLLAVIFRNGKIIIPEGNDHIETHDSLIVVARGMTLLDFDDIFSD